MSGGFTADLPADPGVRRILIMRWSAMGDVALASCAMEDIRRAFPGREIHLNTLPPWDALFQGDARFGKLISFPLRGRWRGMPAMARWVREILAGRYDAVFDLQSNDRSRILMSLLWLSGRAPRYRVGSHRRFPYNVAPAPAEGPIHALERLRATLAAAGVPGNSRTPVLHPLPSHRAHVARLCREHNVAPGEYALFLPGCQAAGYLKRWGARRFIALGLLLKSKGVPRVALIGAGEDADQCSEIAQALGDFAVNLCGQTEILDIVPLAEGARFIVANDTGTAHVAAAADKPMVVVCGPTDPRRVKPAGPNVATLQARLFCVNCYRKHCAHHSCMALVTPDQVVLQLGARGDSAC